MQGILAAVPLAFILPPLCYLKLQSKPWLGWSQAPALAMAVFGILVAVCGLGLLIQQVLIATHGQEVAVKMAVSGGSHLQPWSKPLLLRGHHFCIQHNHS